MFINDQMMGFLYFLLAFLMFLPNVFFADIAAMKWSPGKNNE